MHQNRPDLRRQGSCYHSMGETVILGLCLYLFRYPSLRAFVKEFKANNVALKNLNQFFTVKGIPGDDQFRYILCDIPTEAFNQVLKLIHQRLERKKLVQSFRLLNKFDLVDIDSSGEWSSYKIGCDKCLLRTGSKGANLNMHGQLVASLISPYQPISLTMA